MDRWIFAFGILGAIVIAVVISGPFLITQNQMLIVEKIDNNTKYRTEQLRSQTVLEEKRIQDENRERDQLFQEAKLAILNNVTAKIDNNTHLLRELMIGHNFTIMLDENGTEELREHNFIRD